MEHFFLLFAFYDFIYFYDFIISTCKVYMLIYLLHNMANNAVF